MPTVPFDPDREKQLLAKAAKRLEDKEHIPQDLLDALVEVYAMQIEARSAALPEKPGPVAPAEARAQGAPLVERYRFPIDRAQAGQLFTRLLALAGRANDSLRQAAGVVQAALTAEELDLDAAFQAFLDEDHDYFLAWADRTPQSPLALHFLVQAALSPSVAAAAETLTRGLTLIGEGKSWDHAHCPVCASMPLMGDLREREGFRHLTCSFCRTEYRVPRLGCPICDERDPAKLAYLSSEDEPGFRLDTCRSCMMYLKFADFRNMDRSFFPLFDDLESLSLDILAEEQGFSRPTLSGWGF